MFMISFGVGAVKPYDHPGQTANGTDWRMRTTPIRIIKEEQNGGTYFT